MKHTDPWRWQRSKRAHSTPRRMLAGVLLVVLVASVLSGVLPASGSRTSIKDGIATLFTRLHLTAPKPIHVDPKRGNLECPPTISCTFKPAYFGQSDSGNPSKYGNMDTARRPNDMKIKYIIIHDVEGSYRHAIDWFRDPESQVSAHYVIRSSDGQVTQTVDNNDIGWHASNDYMNQHAIGIEHEGYAAEGGAWYTEALYHASAELVRYLADRYDIPLDRDHIIGHDQYHDISAGSTVQAHNDPGPYWNWQHYMELLRAPVGQAVGSDTHAVTIAPEFSRNKPKLTDCRGDSGCTPLPEHGANFIYLHTKPERDAPLLTDAGMHPGGRPGTTSLTDWSAKAMYGQRFAVAERKGDWMAIWFSGQKGWFYNPKGDDQAAVPARATFVTPRQGRKSIPIYGRPVPEQSAYKNGVPPVTQEPLQYTMPAGQIYVAYDGRAINDYYYVQTFNRSLPGEGTVVTGKDTYIPILYNQRQAFVKASDVRVIGE